MSKGRDYSIIIEDSDGDVIRIDDLTFSETLKIIESTLFSNINDLKAIDKDGKRYDKMEFLELIEGVK